MLSGRRSGPKMTRAGCRSFAHDEKRVRSRLAAAFPVSGSDATFIASGTISARYAWETSSGPSFSGRCRRTTCV